MIPRDFVPPFSFMEWQWFESDIDNASRAPTHWKFVCRACGSLVVERWRQGHAKLHWNRKEVPEGMFNPFR